MNGGGISAIDIHNYKKDPGSIVVFWHPSDHNNQKWKLVPVSTQSAVKKEELQLNPDGSQNCQFAFPSVNGSKHPTGCAGAVWSGGNVSWRYCTGIDNDGNQAYPWYKQCCVL